MADTTNLKINERSNVEQPNLRESLQYQMKIEKIKRRNSFISKGKYENRQNSKIQTIPKFANCRNFDSFPNWKNSKIFLFLEILSFQNWKNSENLLILETLNS